jgi:murein DD-endopeptidase MepM/ murein hydrolase activator NlpD
MTPEQIALAVAITAAVLIVGFNTPAGQALFNRNPERVEVQSLMGGSSAFLYPFNPIKQRPDVKFCDPAYYAGIKGNGGKWLVPPGYWHTGCDFNGPFGGNSDKGYPVVAVAAGVVDFAGLASGTSWGNLVTIWHDGVNIGSRSAHLDRVLVSKGQRVTAGQVIGTVGQGFHGRYLAHLHFDIYVNRSMDAGWWPPAFAPRSVVLSRFRDPAVFLAGMNARLPARRTVLA